MLFKLSNCDGSFCTEVLPPLSTSSTILFCVIWQYHVLNDRCIPVTVPPVRLPEDRSKKLIPPYLAAALSIIFLLISLSRSTVFQPHGGPDRLFLLAPAVLSPVPGQSSGPPSPPELRVLGSIPPSFGCCFYRPVGRYVSVSLHLGSVAKARPLVNLWCRHLYIVPVNTEYGSKYQGVLNDPSLLFDTDIYLAIRYYISELLYQFIRYSSHPSIPISWTTVLRLRCSAESAVTPPRS